MRVKILVFLLALLLVTVVSAQASMSVVDTNGEPLKGDVYVGEALEVKVLVDGEAAGGVDVYFTLNNAAPIHTATNEDGVTVFKPLQTGNLDIKAMEDENLAKSELTVVEKPEETPTPTPTTVRRSGGGGGGGGGGLPLQLTSGATPTPTPTETPSKISTPPIPSTPEETPTETPTPTTTSTPTPQPTETPSSFLTSIRQPTVIIGIAAVIVATVGVVAYIFRK